MKSLNAFILSLFLAVTLSTNAVAQTRSLTPPAPEAVVVPTPRVDVPQPIPTINESKIVLPTPAVKTQEATVVMPIPAQAPTTVVAPTPSSVQPSTTQVTVPKQDAIKPITVANDQLKSSPEDQALSQVTNKEIFDKFKKTIAPVKINEQAEPFKIEYEIPRKTFKKDLSEVSKDLKFKLADKSEKEEFSKTIQDAYKASLSGQLEASIAIYKKALKEEEKNTNILFALASLYHKLMQYPEARSYYKKLLSIDPNYKKAMNNYLALVAEETPSMALQELLEIERSNTEYTPVIAQIGMVYARLQDYNKAEMYLKRAVTMSPEVLAYRYNLAVVYDQMNKYQEAMTLYRQVMDTNNSYEVLPQSKAAIKDRLDYIQTKISIQPTNN